MTTKSRVRAAAAYSWFNNVNHPSHVQVSMGRVRGKAEIHYRRLGGVVKGPQFWWAQCSISNPRPTPIVVATPPRKAP